MTLEARMFTLKQFVYLGCLVNYIAIEALLLVTNSIDAVLSGLIKIKTGLDKVLVYSYLKQAEEIFVAEKAKS